MADEQVIISVNYDTGEAVDNINQLNKSIVNLENSNQILKNTIKESKKDLEKTDDQLKKENKSREDVNQTIKEGSKVLAQNQQKLNSLKSSRKDNIKILQSEAKSIDNLKAQNAALVKERNKLNLSTQEGINRAKQINTQINDNTDKIKKNSSEFEKNKINIGNYASATEGLGEALTSLVPGFGAAAQGGRGLLGVFRKIIANPIGLIIAAIVVALKLMFDALKRTQSGQDKFAEKWMQLKAIFDVIIGRIIHLAKAIIAFLTGDLPKAAKEAEAAFKGIQEEIIAVAAAAKEIHQLTVAIRQLKIENTRASAELNKLAEVQRAIAGDSTRSLQEQLRASDKARVASEKAAKAQVNLSRQQLELIKAENKLKEDQGLLTDDLRQKQADAYSSLIESEKTLLVLQINNNKEREEIRRDFFEQELDYLIDAFDSQKTINERIISDESIVFEKRVALLNDTKKLTESAFEEQIKSVEAYTGEKINADKLIQESDARVLKDQINALGFNEITNNRLLEIIKERRLAIQDLNELDKDLSDEKTKRDEDNIKRIEKANERLEDVEFERKLKEAKNIEEQKQIEIERENEFFQRQLENKDLLDAEIEALEAEHKLRMLDIEMEYQQNVQDEQKATIEKEKEAQKKAEEEKLAFRKQLFDQGKQILDASFSLFSTDLEARKQRELSNKNLTEEQREKIEKKFARKRKALAITEAIINTGLAILNGLKQNPFIPVGLASSVTAGVLGGIQIAKIRRQSFAEGGEVKSGVFGGLPHSMGGTKGSFSDGTNVEVERGERFFVLKKDASAQINALSDINQRFGGRSFGDGGSRYLQDGGEVTPSPDIDIQEALRNTNIVVKVEDITTGIEDRNNVLNAGVLE